MATTYLEEYVTSFQDDNIDPQFKDTYDEVLALKQMLEEFLDKPKEKDTHVKRRDKEQSPPSNHGRIMPVNFQSGSMAQPIQQESSKHIQKSIEATIFGSTAQKQPPIITVEKIPFKHVAMEGETVENDDDDQKQHDADQYQVESYGSDILLDDAILEAVAEEDDSQMEQKGGQSNGSNGHVNLNSLRLLHNSLTYRPNFHHRVAYYMEKNRQEKEVLRKRIQEKEDQQLTLKPIINEKSKTLRRSLSDLNVWASHRQEKLEQLRSLEMERQEASHPGKPSIDEYSAYLFETRHDELSKCKVEDRLHLFGLIYEYQQETKKLEEEKQRQAPYSFHPQLAPHSKNISARSQNVHERLYGLATAQRQEQSPEKEIEEFLEAKRQEKIRSLKDQTQIIEKLYATAEIYRQHRQALAQKMELQRRQLRNESKVSEKSRQLLSKQRARSASPDSLRKEEKSREEDQFSHSHRLERCKGRCSSKDKMNPSPPKRQVSFRAATALYERQMQWKEIVELQRADKRRQQEKQALAECTFKNPLYHPQWRLEMQISDEENKVEDDFYRRSIRWMKERDATVEAEKKLWSEIEVQECTFKPKTITYSNKKPIKKEDDKASSTGATAASSLSQTSLSSNAGDSSAMKKMGNAFPRPSPTRTSHASNKDRSKQQALQNKRTVRSLRRELATKIQTSPRQGGVVNTTLKPKTSKKKDPTDQKARLVFDALEAVRRVSKLANKLDPEEDQRLEREVAEYTAYSSPKSLDGADGTDGASDDEELIHECHDARTHPLLVSLLPPGWEEYFTSEGYPYYHNAKLNVTQWEFPLL